MATTSGYSGFALRFRILFSVVLVVLLALTSAQNVYAATLDQKQENAVAWIRINVLNGGQEFQPSLPTLEAVSVKINTFSAGDGDDTITLTIRQGTIGGSVLATATRSLADGFGGDSGEWVYFTLSPVSVTPGSTYVIVLTATKNTFGWGFGDDAYANGVQIRDGNPYPKADFAFRTYGSGPSVGGVIVTTNNFMTLAPYLALIGLVATSVAVAVKKRLN